MALKMHGIREDVTSIDNSHFLHWYNKRYPHERRWRESVGWAAEILLESSSEEAAFQRTFELLDEYRKLRPVMCAKITLGNHHQSTKKTECYRGGRYFISAPPSKLEIYRYEPENFYFWVQYQEEKLESSDIFDSMQEILSWAEACWQIKPEEWTII